nr:DUF4406 domain-containing protein [Pseudomonas cichorii]
MVNPAELDHPTKEWSECLRRDIVALVACHSVVTLPGWEHPKGARLEVLIAEHLGMAVMSALDLLSVEMVGGPPS